jgi:hypothetical protein
MQNANCKLQNEDAVGSTRNGVLNGKPMTLDEMCDRILDFADRVCSVVESLPDSRLGNRVANQLLRSGTSSIGNYEEACAAESKADFIHKLRICL